MNDPLVITLIGLGLVAVIGVVVWLVRRHRKTRDRNRSHQRLSGSTQMMNSFEVKQRSNQGEYALVHGKLIDPDRPEKKDTLVVADYLTEASVVFGPPGSGKTAFVLAPNAIRHDGPGFFSTTKGDIIQATILTAIQRMKAAQEQGKKYEIGVFDPDDLVATGMASDDRLKTARQYDRVWTPISEAVTWDRASKVASAMLTAVEGTQKGESGNSGFFKTHSTNIVAALLLLARTTPGTDLLNIIERVQELGGVEDKSDDEDDKKPDPWNKLLSDLQNAEGVIKSDMLAMKESNIGADDPRYLFLEGQRQGTRQARAALIPAQGAVKASETRAGIIGAIAQLTTGWLMSPKVMEQEWDSDESFQLEKLADLHTIYMTCPTVEHRPLANAFLGAYMGELHRRAQATGGKLPQRHLVILDELAYCTPHSEMRSWANNVARSANIKLFLGTQAMSDLEIVWGEAESRSLFNACKGSKLLMPGCTDSKALKEFSELAGKRNLVQVSSVAVSTSESSTFSGLKAIPEDGKIQKSKSETVTQAVVEKDTASPARLAAMPADTALAWLPGEPGIRGGTVQLRTLPYFEEGSTLRAASEGDPSAVATVGRPPSKHAIPVNLEDPLAAALKSEKEPAQ